MWVLMIMSYVYSGRVVQFQTFSSKKNCEIALTQLKTIDERYFKEYQLPLISCVKK